MIKRIYNSARIRLSRTLVPLILRFRGIGVGAKTCLIGLPLVDLNHDTAIHIGNRVSILSKSWATALGVNHPTVLRTLQSGASIVIGDGTGISGGALCAAKSIKIGRKCLFGANVTVVDTDFHNLTPSRRHTVEACHADARSVTIGDNVFLGTGTIILKGVHIGNHSVIGAGSVVSKDIPSGVIAAGNPCRVMRELDTENT